MKPAIERAGHTLDLHVSARSLRVNGDAARLTQVLSNLLSNHRILIVDDNVDAAETLCMLIKSLGEREVHTVSSGEQALEVARRMRSQPWGKDLLLVALSGWGHEEYRRRSKEAGFDQHVTKPADLSALKAVLGARQ